MQSEAPRIPHVRALDGLRGVAVLGVLLFHSDRILGGYLGVDLFFVLSGFLITSLLLAEHEQRGTVSLGAFWARRARRLLPALALVILAVAAYCVVFAARGDLERIRGDAFATLGYVANWRAVFRDVGYFELLRTTPSPLDHTWSLAIEEQFYLVWPLLFLGIAAALRRRTAQGVLVAAVVLGVASAALMTALWSRADVSRAYYGTDTRALALFAGVGLAALVAMRGHPGGRVARPAVEALGIAAVLWLAWLWTHADGESARMYHGGFLSAAVAAALVIAAAANPRRGLVARVFEWAPLVGLGLISYGLYLWHWPVNLVLDETRTGLDGWALFALRSAAAIAVAYVSYRFVEMPIRRGALRPTQWRVVIPGMAALLVATVFVSTLGATDRVRPIAGPPRIGNEILLVGDSLANSLGPGLADHTSSLGMSWIPGCRLVHGTIAIASPFARDCPWDRRWPTAARRVRPKDVVVWVGMWDLFDVRVRPGEAPVGPGDAAWDALYRRQLARLVALLRPSGARITLLTLPCIGPPDTPRAAALFRDGASDPARIAAANAIIEDVGSTSGPSVGVADVHARLCPRGTFQESVDGVATRSDGAHLSEAGADLVARWLLPQLAVNGTRD